MEYLDLYDEKKFLTGEKILRTKDMKIPEGKYVNIVIIFIQNSEGKFLIQKTSKQKGGIWATTGGHVKSGDSADDTIVEEVKEELGVVLNIKDIELILTEKRKRAFQDVYYIKKDIDINNLTLQDEEVQFVKWLSVDEINNLIENCEFREGNINSFKHLIKEKNL